MRHSTKTLLAVLFLTLFATSAWTAQAQNLQKADLSDNAQAEAPIYTDTDGTKYSTVVTMSFAKHVMDVPKGTAKVSTATVRAGHKQVKAALKQIETNYGDFELVKVYPDLVWGDTLRRHRRTGKMVGIPDMSQRFELTFDKPVPIKDIITRLKLLSVVEYAHGPMIVRSTTDEPNDWAYQDGHQWAPDTIDAPKAWELAKGRSGSGPMQIAILDEWNPNVTERHPDLAYEPNRGAYRLTNDFGYYGEHGLRVASMAGAITDNNDGPTWMASVGWNTKLRGYHRADTLVKEAVRDGADVINCSWVVRFLYSDPYKTDLAEEVRSALEQGVVVVASAGNDERCTECVKYPAAYNFTISGERHEVIATSGTMRNDHFRDGWTYSPGTDPVNSPTQSFIDVAAPSGEKWGKGVYQLFSIYDDSTGTTNHTGSANGAGTSLAAPQVSATAALILSLNPNLKPPDVYDIITKTPEKVGKSNYDYTGLNGETWSRYKGYGRLNVYQALKHTLENYDTKIGRPGDNIVLHDNYTLEPDATLTVRQGTTVDLKDGVGITAEGTFDPDKGTTFQMGQSARIKVKKDNTTLEGTQSDPIRFEPLASGDEWRKMQFKGADGSTLKNAVVDGGYKGAHIKSKNVTLENVRITNSWRGIDAGSTPSGNNGSFSATNVIVENSGSVGVLAYNADFSFDKVTVQNNDEEGVYLLGGEAYPVYKSVIRNNAVQQTTDSGILVLGGSTLRMMGTNYGRGYTRVAFNPEDQIEVQSEATSVELGILGAGGYNAVYDEYCCGFGSGPNDIYADRNVEAEETYWGPNGQEFGGSASVNTFGALSSDPTSGSGADSSTVPMKVAPAGGGPTLASAESAASQSRHTRGATKSREAVGPSPDEVRAKIRARMKRLRGKLTGQRSRSDSAAAWMRSLYALQRLADAESVLGGEREANMSALASHREKLESGDALPANVQTASETAALLTIREAMFEEHYAKAKRLVEQYGNRIEGADHRRQLLLERASLLERDGKYDEALATFETFLGTDSPTTRQENYDAAVYETAHQILQAKAEGKSKTPDAEAGEHAAKAAVSDAPERLQLKAAYPNPAQGRATVPLALPEAADVRVAVYDVLGRRVRTLASGELAAGEHRFALEAGDLPSGVYLVRARAQSPSAGTRVFTRKVTLAR